jgi:hypothetical protein
LQIKVLEERVVIVDHGKVTEKVSREHATDKVSQQYNGKVFKNRKIVDRSLKEGNHKDHGVAGK